MSRGVVLHITKSELKEAIKEEIRNYLLLERDLTQVKDPRTLSKADRIKRAEQMRAMRAKAPKKEPGFFDRLKSAFTPETEEDQGARNVKNLKQTAKFYKDQGMSNKDIKALTGYYSGVGVTADQSEEDIKATQKLGMSQKKKDRATVTDTRNAYYQVILAKLMAMVAKAIGVKTIPKSFQKVIAKKALQLAAKVAARVPMAVSVGPVTGAIFAGSTMAEMAVLVAELASDYSRFKMGQQGTDERQMYTDLRSQILSLSQQLKSDPNWKNSEEAKRWKKGGFQFLQQGGYLERYQSSIQGDIIRGFKSFPIFGRDEDKYDLVAPNYKRYVKMLNSLGPQKKKRNPFVKRQRREEPRVAQDTAQPKKDTAQPKKKKLSRRQYRRKFWSVLTKAGKEFGRGKGWKGLKRNHPARVAYRDFARVGKKVPSGIQTELRSLGLLT